MNEWGPVLHLNLRQSIAVLSLASLIVGYVGAMVTWYTYSELPMMFILGGIVGVLAVYLTGVICPLERR
jgi:hypothetical protein